MAGDSTVRLTINFNDPDADASERNEEVRKLLTQLKDWDEIESVERVRDPNPPEGNKSLGGFVVGLMTAEINATSFKKLLGFLGDRLGGKPIELEVEVDGNSKKLKVKASSREELEAAIKIAKDFVGG